MRKILVILFACLAISCAETPDGWIVMNEETIENFFEHSKKSWAPPMQLNLEHEQPVTAADVPPVPSGLIRISGTLASAGSYMVDFKNSAIDKRGSTFRNGVYGMLGPASEGGNAWFYADADPITGRITGGRAYLYGFMGGVCDLREKIRADYGQINTGQMSFSIAGYCLFPQMPGSASEYALLVQGHFPNLEAGTEFPVEYVMDDSGKITAIPKAPRANRSIFDSGTGIAKISQPE